MRRKHRALAHLLAASNGLAGLAGVNGKTMRSENLGFSRMNDPRLPSTAGVLELLRRFDQDTAFADRYAAACLEAANAAEPVLKAFEYLPLDVRRRIGVVIQEQAADLLLNVRDNLLTFARFHGKSGAAVRSQADQVKIGRAHV